MSSRPEVGSDAHLPELLEQLHGVRAVHLQAVRLFRHFIAPATVHQKLTPVVDNKIVNNHNSMPLIYTLTKTKTNKPHFL